MDDTRWERLAAATGIAFVVLTLVAFFLVPQPPKPGDPVEEIVAYHVDNHGRLLVQAFFFGLAGAFFLWFLGSIRSFLRRAEGGTGRLSALSFGAGVATVTLFFVGGIFFTSLATLGRSGAEEAGAAAAELFTLGNVAFALVSFPAAVFIGAASVLVVRNKALPGWFGWYGGFLALAALVSATSVFVESGFLAQGEGYGIISFAYLLWALVASFLMIQRLGQAVART